VTDPRAVLREVHRLLVPGGVAVVTTPSGSGLVQWGVNLTGWFANRDVQDEAIPVRRVRRWAEEAGLRVERVILDGAAYFMMVAWPRWLRWLIPAAARAARIVEPLPIIRGLICDQAKYVLIKPMTGESGAGEYEPGGTSVHPTAPPEYVESEDDRRLLAAVRAAEAPRQGACFGLVRGIFSVVFIPLAYAVLTAVLLPVSLVLLAWEVATGRRGAG